MTALDAGAAAVVVCLVVILAGCLVIAWLPAPSDRRARRRGGVVDESVFRKIGGRA